MVQVYGKQCKTVKSNMSVELDTDRGITENSAECNLSWKI
jgi:hypothetical protein